MVRLLQKLAFASLTLASSSSAVRTQETAIDKVIKLLRNMEKEVQGDMARDAETSKKLQCWAAKLKDEKEVAISDAEIVLESTSAKIEKLTGSVSRGEVELKKLEKSIATNESDLKTMQSERDKEGGEFDKLNLETTTQLEQLKGAIEILRKHSGSKDSLAQVRKALAKASITFPNMASLQESQSAIALLEYAPHNSASGEIFGILSQMLEQMDGDLSEKTKTEAENKGNFKEMRSAKREELGNQRQSREKKMEQLASDKQELARSKKKVANVTAQLESDRKILGDANEKAKADKDESVARSQAQSEELDAIGKTIDILTNDETRAHFKSTGAVAFLQINKVGIKKSDVNSKARKAKAAEIIRKASKNSSLPSENKQALSLLSISVQLNAFTKVKAAIDSLIKDLKQKKADEVKQRDSCISNINNNNEESQNSAYEMEDLGSQATKLEGKSKQLADVIEATQAAQVELNQNIATATNLRVEENAEYQKGHNEFILTKNILSKAIVQMQSIYKNQSFLEQDPAGLKAGGYKKNASGTGVVNMIRTIVADAEAAAAESTSAEQTATTEYETAMTDFITQASTLKSTLIATMEDKAATDEKHQEVKGDEADTFLRMELLDNEKKALHEECDFLLQNFDNRQAGFGQEAEALEQAKQILSGMQGE